MVTTHSKPPKATTRRQQAEEGSGEMNPSPVLQDDLEHLAYNSDTDIEDTEPNTPWWTRYQ